MTKLLPFTESDEKHMLHWYYCGQYKEFFRDVPAFPRDGYFKSYANFPNGKCLLVYDDDFNVAGCVILYDISERAMTCSAAIMVDASHQSSGLYLSALTECIRVVYNEMNMHSVAFEVFKRNAFMVQSMRMAGCRYEGTHKYGAKIDGKYEPVMRFAIEKKQAFRALRKIEEKLYGISTCGGTNSTSSSPGQPDSGGACGGKCAASSHSG